MTFDFQPQMNMNENSPQIPQTSAEKNPRSSAQSAAKEDTFPKISATVPVYSLPECSESDVRGSELILVGNAPQDSSVAICALLAESFEQQARYW